MLQRHERLAVGEVHVGGGGGRVTKFALAGPADVGAVPGEGEGGDLLTVGLRAGHGLGAARRGRDDRALGSKADGPVGAASEPRGRSREQS